jgi:hypothetical protein
MLKIFLITGGVNNGSYEFPLRLLKKELNDALLVIPHMSRADANKFMLKEGLMYKDICTLAKDEYRSQFDLDEWPPACQVKDTKALPSEFANLTEARVHPDPPSQCRIQQRSMTWMWLFQPFET